MNKRKIRKYGDFNVFKKHDFPHEKILNVYPVFHGLENNPVFYFLSAGYLKYPGIKKVNLLKIIMLSLLFITPLYSIYLFLIYLMALLLYYLYSKFNSNSSGNTSYKQRLSTKRLLEFLGIKDVNKFQDLALSEVSGKDFVLAFIAKKISFRHYIIYKSSLYVMIILALSLSLKYEILFLYAYIPLYLFCIYAYFDKNHVLIVENKIQKMRNRIDRLEIISMHEADFHYVLIILYIFLFTLLAAVIVIPLLINIFQNQMFSNLFSGEVLKFIMAVSGFILTLIYPIYIFHLYITGIDNAMIDKEIDIMSKKLSVIIRHALYCIHEPTTGLLPESETIKRGEELLK